MRSRLTAVLVVVACVLMLVAPAHAAFPGQNGEARSHNRRQLLPVHDRSGMGRISMGVRDRWKSCTLNPYCCESGFTFAAHTQEKSIAMEAKLYVGNLPYTTVDADLETLFSQAGTVKSAQVIRDRASGRSKGFGFVEMSSSDEAQSAITMFHGKDFSGRPLTVNLARPA